LLLHGELTDQIIGGCYSVYREWGFGFLEAVYKNSLAVELGRRGLTAKREVPVHLHYLGVPVGAYRIDMLVENKVIRRGQIAERALDRRRQAAL